MKLTRMEWSELGLIVAAIGATWFLSAGFTWTVPFGKLVGYSAAVLLGQGLVRDVVRLMLTRGQEKAPKRRIGCLCAESTIGLLLVAIAIGLTLIGITQTVALGQWALTGLVGAMFLGGFFAKDFIIIVRREKDHGSVVVWGD